MVSLADQIADLEDPTPKDFDPEDQNDRSQSSDDDAAPGEDETAAREHYQAVGKSKLRKPESVPLGKQYAGAHVSRDALHAEDSDDDPFARRSGSEKRSESEDVEDDESMAEDIGAGEINEDDEIDSDEAFEEGEEETFKGKGFTFRGSGKGPSTPTDSEEDEEEEEDDENDDMDEIDDMRSSEEDLDVGDEDDEDDEDDLSNEDDDEDDDEDEEEDNVQRMSKKSVASDDREELRRLMATDQKTVATSISAALKADAAKGVAVKRQRSAFDALLNSRIKLQKGFTAMNNFTSDHGEQDNIDVDAVKSAESAALALWSNLEELRLALAESQPKHTSKNRKRPAPPTADTPSSALWERMQDLESQSVPHRRAVLDKWSNKVRGSSTLAPNARGKLMNKGSSGQQSITTVLDAHIGTETGERLAKRARTIGAEDSESSEREPVYDDAAFYQALLRDLVDQRMSSSSAITNGAMDSLTTQLPSRLSLDPTTGMRKDKKKKAVDTKASKGRKMRFTVHEKLQNFMAPEERGAWSVKARDEFFASLLGRSVSNVLGEDDEDDSGAEEDAEEGGLKLFRSG